MNSLSTSQLKSVSKLIESRGETIVFAENVDKQHKRKQRIEKRVIVITQYRVITLRSGIVTGYREAREGLIINMEYLILDDSDRISLQIDGWGITFHTLHTEQCIASLLDRYNTLSVLIPDDKRAKISINPNAISHTPYTKSIPHPDPVSNNSAYCEALRAMYHALCNKYSTQPLTDIEVDLLDRCANGCKELILLSSRRKIDAPQCAAIVELLKWDTWFETVDIQMDHGTDDSVLVALRSVIGVNSTIQHLHIDSITAHSKQLHHITDALTENTQIALTDFALNNIPLTFDFIGTLIPVLPSLNNLSFAHCGMGQSVMVHLFNVLQDTATLTDSLISLDVSYNTLGPDGTNALAQWLSNCNPKRLNSLNVAGTNIAWSVFINAIQRQSLKISHLDISSHTLYDRVFCVLNPYVAGGHIKSLVMGAMKGDPTMVEGICGSLLLNSNLKETTLVLDNTDMDFHLQERLISLVAQSSSLQELSIRKCNMNDTCISMLFDVLTKFKNCKLRRLYIDGNLNMPEVGKSSEFLCTLLTESKTLEELSMNGCHGLLVSKIADGLHASSTIRVLHMDDCGIMDDDIRTLCNACINHTSLQTLTVDRNNILVNGFERIHEMLKSNKTITDMGVLRSLPEIERLFSNEDREKVQLLRRESFILMMKNRRSHQTSRS